MKNKTFPFLRFLSLCLLVLSVQGFSQQPALNMEKKAPAKGVDSGEISFGGKTFGMIFM
jgi:hypothetical protein